MTIKVANGPINRIKYARITGYDPSGTELQTAYCQSGTEPITDNELGRWIHANARDLNALQTSFTDDLAEQPMLPRAESRTSRDLDERFLQDAYGNLKNNFESLFFSAELDFLRSIRLPDRFYSTPNRKWDDLFQKLNSYSQLKDGWNSYAAPRPSLTAISNARNFLNVLYVVAKLLPNRVRPSSVGGIGITFRNQGRKAYVEFLNNRRTHVLLSDGVGDPETYEASEGCEAFLKLVADIRRYLNG
jgi:hypothetical protein